MTAWRLARFPTALPCRAGVPGAPLHLGETAEIGAHRAPGLPLENGDAALGLGDLAPQGSDLLLSRLGARARHLTDLEPGNLHCLQHVAVPLELNPVPGDVAVAVRDHMAP